MSQSILVTGGTGSFGSTFLKHLCSTTTSDTWRRIICFSRDELKQSELQRDLHDDRLRWFLGDIRDKDRLSLALRDVQVVVHAAALKQVPALEYNPTEAVQTNVIGSMNLMRAAMDAGVERVVALSTDKAVSPVNLYGSTKLCMERMLLAANAHCSTRFSIVRYGNVAGSRGSVIPLFRSCMTSARVLPITDRLMTRFWITLPQAVTFVEQVLETTGDGVAVPRMPSVRLTDLADAVAPGYPQRIVGTRPGEKIHETVVGAHEDIPGVPSPYASDTNTEWLEGKELAEAVACV